jgi:hypothetical protein
LENDVDGKIITYTTRYFFINIIIICDLSRPEGSSVIFLYTSKKGFITKGIHNKNIYLYMVEAFYTVLLSIPKNSAVQ